MHPSTLDRLLEERITEDSGIVLVGNNGQDEFLSYARLYALSMNALGYLQQKGMAPGDELIIQASDNRTFLLAFWACQLGGMLPIPLSTGLTHDNKEKLINVWKTLHHPRLLASLEDLDKACVYAGLRNESRVADRIRTGFIDEAGLSSSGEEGVRAYTEENAIALIQFSSGSTGSPKGVVLSHANLLANMRSISTAANYTAADRMMGWMPLTHDMGLIGFHLNPLLAGMNHYLLPTSLFVRRPLQWLDKASAHGITILCSPNFGYRYVLKQLEKDPRQDWDLSAVRLLYNGAEPVSGALCREFLGAMARFGLRSAAMCPVYGLAEATLAVTISDPSAEVISLVLNRDFLNTGDRIVADGRAGRGVELVNVGKGVECCSLRIADDRDVPADEDMIGHVQIAGASVTRGYYNNAAETIDAFTRDGWLRTGDIGFIHDDALYITGRAKDIVFINGQNYYPADIERVAEEIDGIELNRIAVTGWHNEATGEEEVVAYLSYKGERNGFIALAGRLRAHIGQRIGLDIAYVVPVPEMPKTTSGKLQRHKLLQRWKAGEYAALVVRPEPERTGDGEAPAMSLPPVERRLKQLWSKVLGKKNIGAGSGFFEMGGTSLKAAELTMLLWKEFQLDLPLGFLYEKPTLREMAGAIESLSARRYLPLPPARPGAAYPLSSAQRRVYYAWKTDKHSTGYNIPLAFRLTGEIDGDDLQEGIRALIAAHDALRIYFIEGDEPAFGIRETAPFVLDRRECEAVRLAECLRDLVRPFDLEQDVLLRACLLHVGEREDVLFLDLHHSVSDGTSVYYFLEELLQRYNGISPATAPAGYAAYALWENEWLAQEIIPLQEGYWLDRLKGELPVLQLPADFQRPAVLSTEGAKIEFRLDEATSRGLEELARANGCPLYVLLFTIYGLLLTRFAGEPEAIIGMPVAARSHPDLAAMQGMFVNNLALRFSVQECGSFPALLAAMKQQLADALRHQDYPFELLLRHIEGRRNVSRNPLFDTMFIYQSMRVPEVRDGRLKLERKFFDPGIAKYDLSLEVFEPSDAVVYAIEYSTGLFRPSTAEELGRRFGLLCRKVVGDPQIRLNELNLLSPDEYNDHIYEYNRTAHYLAPVETISRLFDKQARRTPRHAAIEDDGLTVTYGRLREQIGGMAQQLRMAGAGRDRVIAVLMERSAELIAVVLAILESGGCFLPVDPELPDERIRYMLADSQSLLLLCSPGQRSRAETLAGDRRNGGVPVLVATCDGLSGMELWEQQPEKLTEPGRPADASSLAYILYTSGTTGNPKGVAIEHRSIANYLQWAAEQYAGAGRADWPLYTSISFDLTLTSFFLPLITGNTVIVYREDRSLPLITRLMADDRVECIKLTPSHLRMLRDNAVTGGNGAKPSRLKRLVVGGEKLETPLARAIHELFDGRVELFNEYGPTEATVGCMIHRFDAAEPYDSVPIGVPAWNMRIYVLDANRLPVPPLVNGEVYISGLGVARGYIYKEALTAERFLPDPFVKEATMYKTGDLARRWPEGTIEYIGRRDEQVKINGYRIEPAEIAAQLRRLGDITDAVVVAKTDGNHRKSLWAYYLGESTITEAALRDFLASRVPHYMIPAHFIRLEAFPLTKNGKIDPDALPTPVPEEQSAPPVTGAVLEESIRVWQEVLNDRTIGIRDNFFDLGGDSIKALQITSKLFDKGIALTVKDILTYHTIEHIGRYARLIGREEEHDQGIVTGERPLTPIERWLLRQKLGNYGYYNQSALFRTGRNIDPGLLGRAFGKLIEHHDGLRMNLRSDGHTIFYNNAHLAEAFPIACFDSGEPETQARVISDLKSRFDPGESLLLRAALLSRGEQTSALFITAHHLVMDGYSWRILLEDLYSLYVALEKGAPLRLQRKTASLIEWQQTLDDYARSARMQGQQEWWESLEAVRFSLPRDFAQSDWRIANQETVTRIMDRERTLFLLKDANKPYRTNIFTLLLTALALALREWTEQNVLLIETEGYGRELSHADFSRTIGWFTAMYPVKIELGSWSTGELIRAVKEQVMGVPDNGIGYGVYRYYLNADRQPAGRLTEIRFNYLGQFDTEFNNDLFTYSAESTGAESDPANLMTAVLELNALVTGGQLVLELSYNKTAHRSATIQEWLDRISRHLDNLAGHLKSEREVHFTPSDFDNVDLDQQELDALFS